MNQADRRGNTRIFGSTTILLVGLVILLVRRFPLPLPLFNTLQGAPGILAMLAIYGALVALLTSLIDRFDAADHVAAYHHFGRWFWWLGLSAALLTGSLIIFGWIFPALNNAVRWGGSAVMALCAILFIVFLDQPAPQRQRPTSKAKAGASSSTAKTVLAFLLMATAGLLIHQRYKDYQERERGYAASDAAERRAAKPWRHEFDNLPGGLSVDELKTRVAGGGHRLTCYPRAELIDENRLQEDDTHNCWVNIGLAWGIPSHLAMFGFGQHGLRSQALRFPESSWPEVEAHLNRIGQRQAQTFGIDPASRQPISGWRLDSGLAFSTAPPPGEEVVVLWTAKEDLARLYCSTVLPRKKSAYSVDVSTLWPEIDCRMHH